MHINRTNIKVNFKLKAFQRIFYLLFLFAFLSLSKVSAQTEIIFKNNVVIQNAPGEYYFTVTENTRMTFEVWGGGGRGGGMTSGTGGAGGGGGGAYARKTVDLEVGQRIDITVGAGGSGNSIHGGISEVKLNGVTILKADGGEGVVNNSTVGGAGGLAGNSTGDIVHSGGNGANENSVYGGGGGSSAGPAENGSSGSGSNGGTAPSNGGNGGNGKTGLVSSGSGEPGVSPGGGGGGAKRVTGNNSGGNGASGRLRIMNMCRAYWYKADMPGSIPGHGNPLATWQDKTENNNHGISPTSDSGGYTKSDSHPKWYDNKINFNPAVEFIDGYYLANRRSVGNDMALYVVFSTKQSKPFPTNSSGEPEWWNGPALIGGEAKGTQADWGLSLNAGKLFFKSTADDNLEKNPQTTEAYNTGKTILASGFRKMGDKAYIHVNGKEQVSEDTDGGSLSDTPLIGVGRNPTETDSQFQGFIAEVTALNNMCNQTDKEINDTYFAIKYGITLEHDYKRRHGRDSVIYSISSHKHDIAGLGRQDYTLELHQKISSSSNVESGELGRLVIATNDNFTGSNVTTSRPAVEDGQYLIWGHNNGGAGWTTVNDKISRQKRVWKIQNTANASGKIVTGTHLQINLNDGSMFPPIDNKSEVYAILLSNDSTFTEGLSYVPLLHGAGNLYSTAIDFPADVSYFTVAKMHKNYWIGGNSTDWNNPNNWSSGFIPPSDEDVIFATNDNYGSEAMRDIVIEKDQHLVTRNFTNETTRNLVIEPGASLRVNGVLSVADATNPDRIQIKADATNPNGSLIINNDLQKTSSQKDIYATIHMYAKGKKLSSEEEWIDDIDGSPTEGNTFKNSYTWQFFGVPVESVRAEPTFNKAFVREYFENYNGEDNSQYYQKWKNIYNNDYLEAFRGYEITQESPTIYTIQGKLVYGDRELTMTRKAPAVNGVHYGLGQNIFANSYAAAIKVDHLIFPEEAEHTVYLYNTGSFTDWSGATGTNEGTTLSAGQYTAIPRETSHYDGKIPSMNAFLVRFLPQYTTYNRGDATLTIQYAKGDGVDKNTKPQTAPRQLLSWLEVMLTSDDNSVDRLWLYNQEGTTASFDNGWDGFKFFGTPNAFIYTETDAGSLQVDTDETINGKLISFYANKNGNYTLHLVRSQLQGYEYLHLLDLETHRSVAIDRDTVSYSFTANSMGEVMRRFTLIDSPFPEMEKEKWSLLTARIYNKNVLSIQNFTTLPSEIKIFDIGGRLLMQDKLNKTSRDYILPFPSGVYVLHIQAGMHQVVEKVIVR